MLAQQLHISFSRATDGSLTQRILQKMQRQPKSFVHCGVWGKKRVKAADAFVSDFLEYATFCQWTICPRDTSTSKLIFRLGYFCMNVWKMMGIWKVKQAKNPHMLVCVFGDLLSITLCSRNSTKWWMLCWCQQEDFLLSRQYSPWKVVLRTKVGLISADAE